jgi:hypothetical protein
MNRLAAAAAFLLLASCAAPGNTLSLSAEPPHKPKPAQTSASDYELALRKLRELRPQIEELIRELGNSDYRTREDASMSLLGIGIPALPAIEEAAGSPDAQVSHLAEELVVSLTPRYGGVFVEHAADGRWQIVKEQLISEEQPFRRLSDLLAYLRSTLRVNVFVHPGVRGEDSEITPPREGDSLENYLLAVAEQLDAAWVARFDVLLLATPETAIEFARATVLAGGDAALLKRSFTVSLKDANLADVLDFFCEVLRLHVEYTADASAGTKVGGLELREIAFRDALSIVLFALGLRGELKGNTLIISPADYSAFSASLRRGRDTLKHYRQAWQELKTNSD